MKKYRFSHLAIEITRRCNKKCIHCVRGDAQNLTMSREVIDRIFEDVANVDKIALFSGEVLLEIDTIDYLIQKINRSHWTTKFIEVTTNGTICDDHIINLFESFCTKENERYVLIRISNDSYHNPEEYENAYAYYEQLVSEANKRIKSNHPDSNIFLKYTIKSHNEESSNLVYGGRAKELIDNGGKYEKSIFGTRFVHCYHHRLKIIDDFIPCSLQISANGNVTYNEFLDYDTLDALSIGNILESNLTDIINKHNNDCMILCSETDKLLFADYGKYYADWGNSAVPLSFELKRILYDRIIELRQLAKRKYPDVPAAEIITKIQFPNQFEEIFIYKRLHNSCQCASYGGKLGFTITEDNPNYAEVINLLFMELLYGLKHEPGRKKPYHLFGDEADKMRWLREKGFGELQLRYLLMPSKINNSKNFYCNELIDNTINYKEDLSVFDDSNDFTEYIQKLYGVDVLRENPTIQKICENTGMSFDELKKEVRTIFREQETIDKKKLEDFISRSKIS